MSSPEPWLRGPLQGIHPLVMPVFFSFIQVREDLREHLNGLTEAQIWRAFGKVSIGFQLQHMAGSVDRLTTYLKGQQLTNDQLRALHEEGKSGSGLAVLLQQLEASLESAERFLRTIDERTIYDQRHVGRKNLPTTVIGLLVHLAEHTQRHLGQVITLSGIVRQST